MGRGGKKSKMLNFLSELFQTKKRANKISPESFGWEKKHDSHYEKEVNGHLFMLYQGYPNSDFVFDQCKKDAPGVISRITPPLLYEDFMYMDAVMKRISGN